MKSLLLLTLLFLPTLVFAHGGVDDGHIEVIEWIQLVGISLISIALIAYSYGQWRKEKNKR